MKITFLGTSAGWPLPRLGCDCEICASRDPKDNRTRPAILINDLILVDCGPDIYHQLKREEGKDFKLKNLKALIITHAHPDHVFGFYDLTHLYNLQSAPRIYITHETLTGLRQYYPWPTNPFKVEVIKRGEVFEFEKIKFSLVPVVHGKFPTWGVKIKDNKLVGYFPDLGKLPKSSERTCKGLDYLILDGSSLGKAGQARNHESITEGINLAKRLKAKNVYFTHIGHKTGRHEELESFVQKEGGSKFHIAFDGFALEF